jgi:hypothetical protein
MVGLLDNEMQHINSKISTWITKTHKPCIEGQSSARCRKQLDLD